MKKSILLIFSFLILTACSSVKRGQQALNKGNYTEAIAIAVEKLQKDKDKKANQEHILILEDAFKKHTEATKKRISFLKKAGNPTSSREIYRLYQGLQQVQQQISPLLPLNLYSKNREAKFKFADYSEDIIAARNDYADFLYEESRGLMQKNDKMAFRQAHQKLSELDRLYPNYKDTEQLLEKSHFYGTDFVFVELKNETPLVIPQRLEQELLDFNTYGLDDFWTEYHASMSSDHKYDFAVNLNFREIVVSPERVLEREIPLEAEVLESSYYKKDRKGEFVLDSLGNKIKIENFKTVKGVLYKTIQTKTLALQGEVDYIDLHQDRLLNSYPLGTEFIFENVFASFKGDERLLNKEDKLLLQNRFVPFPTTEQMLVDASEELKGRLGPILKRNRLR
ncbi:hypothetical protein SAMN04488034_101172 [Salinimicrobium catena]|uniref:Lipoprotein n=1 Tax=Salinimicrobium catena TaxID=390640 RepID=A0A1H5HKP5_9FLAO|nr:hypothetical protein [Salinimicrobium catena]SDK70432.1 hypothetical protein SAMN04488140_101172 [Salinimicrobium catena]SEE27818.1 hypothetical protein SAMN04488034_101172 [Salinimicrobium catena]